MTCTPAGYPFAPAAATGVATSANPAWAGESARRAPVVPPPQTGSGAGHDFVSLGSTPAGSAHVTANPGCTLPLVQHVPSLGDGACAATPAPSSDPVCRSAPVLACRSTRLFQPARPTPAYKQACNPSAFAWGPLHETCLSFKKRCQPLTGRGRDKKATGR